MGHIRCILTVPRVLLSVTGIPKGSKKVAKGKSIARLHAHFTGVGNSFSKHRLPSKPLQRHNVATSTSISMQASRKVFLCIFRPDAHLRRIYEENNSIRIFEPIVTRGVLISYLRRCHNRGNRWYDSEHDLERMAK